MLRFEYTPWKKSSTYFYKLANTVLDNPYLALSASGTPRAFPQVKIGERRQEFRMWLSVYYGQTIHVPYSQHLLNGIIRRNISHISAKCGRTAYVSLIRSTLEYGAVIWDLFLQLLISINLKMFNVLSVRITNPGTVAAALEFRVNDLERLLIEESKKQPRLTFMFNVVEGLIPAIPWSEYFVPEQNKRKIHATLYKDCESTNIVSSYELKNKNKKQKTTVNALSTKNKTTIYKHSFFVRTVHEWNQL